ncbi:MAG: hypothetical protein HC896_06010 [Bacteroidales bacterium]|nr:hypothetical protein [Bacteroidales bacterium]
MKKVVKIVLVLLIITSCACRQEVVTESDFTDDHFFINHEIKPYEGICVTLFNKTETVKAKMFFKEGVMEGLTTTFYNNGSKQQEGNYKRGKFHGEWKKWYACGNLAYDITYANGMLNGKYVLYHRNGAKKEEGKYMLNKRAGLWKTYNELGELTAQVEYGPN